MQEENLDLPLPPLRWLATTSASMPCRAPPHLYSCRRRRRGASSDRRRRRWRGSHVGRLLGEVAAFGGIAIAEEERLAAAAGLGRWRRSAASPEEARGPATGCCRISSRRCCSSCSSGSSTTARETRERRESERNERESRKWVGVVGRAPDIFLIRRALDR